MMKTRQRGGTFLGLIVGLVVGLAIALAVAVYVTKVPVPFVHHDASRSSLQNEAEAVRNRDWNPNAALQAGSSDSAAPGAAGGTAASTPGVASGAVAPPAVASGHMIPVPVPGLGTVPATTHPTAQAAQPAAGDLPESAAPTAPGVRTAPIRSAQTRSTDPLGELVASRAPESATGRTAPPSFQYFVQVGAFHSAQDADAQRARLSLIGVQARVSERDQAGGAVFRVRAGPYQDQQTANQVQTRLASNGFDAALVRAGR